LKRSQRSLALIRSALLHYHMVPQFSTAPHIKILDFSSMRRFISLHLTVLVGVALAFASWAGPKIPGGAVEAAQSMAFVQAATKAQTSGQTASNAFASNVTSGDLLVVGVFVDLGATVTVTDSRGDVFTQIVHQPVANDHDADVLVSTASSSGTDTITVNAGTGKNVYAFSIHEYSGVTSAVDGVSTAQGNNTSPASGNLTTGTPNDLVFVWFTNGSNFQNENFPSLSSSYTKRELSGTGVTQCYAFANCVQSADLFTTATVTTNATATLNAADIWSATVVAFKRGSDTTPPSVPTNLAVTGTTASTVSLAWTASTDNVGVTGYKIYRAGAQVGTATTTSYTDVSLTSSTSYSYTVLAYDAAGNNSAQSPAVLATTQTLSDTTAPSVPTNLTVTGTTASTVSLGWTASTDNVGVAGYKIYRAGAQVGTASTNSYTDTGLTASTAYSYAVSAYDAAGNNSALSSPVQATTLARAPTITSFSANPAVIASGQKSTLSWTVSNATSLSLNGINVTGANSLVVSSTATTTYVLTATNNGGSATTQTTVTVSSDTTPPTVSITAPASGVTVSGLVPISATASDNVAVASVAFDIDGSAIATDTSSPYNVNWSSTTVANGTHTITAVAVDTSGNQATSSAVTIVVNNSSSQSTAFIQSASQAQTNGQTASKIFARNVTSGDLLVVGVFVDLGATVTVTDSRGDVFTQIVHQPVANDHDADVLVSTASSSGTDTITVNAGTGKNVYAFSIHEYSGVTSAVDGVSTAQGNNTSPASGNLTTGTPNDLVFVWFTNGSNFQNENFPSLSSSYTKRELSGTGVTQCYAFANCVQSADLFTTATVTTNATATLNAADIWSATVVAFKQGSDTTPPSVPTNLTVTGTTASTVSLAWTASTDNVGVAGYKIYRAGAQVGTTSATSYTDTGLAPSTAYSYTVSAYDAAGNNSGPSSATQGTTTQTIQDATAPTVPTNLQAVSATSSNVTFSWTASTDNVGVTGYDVFRNDVQVGMTAQTTYTDAPLTPSTAYKYTVAAFDASGNVSAKASPELSVTTLPSSGSTVYPLKKSANGRYLTDKNGSPLYVIGDSPHSLLVNLDPTTMASYMADRQARGFNAILVQILCNDYTGGYPNGMTYDGVNPFISGSSPANYDLSQPNPAYFAKLDSLVALAATYNLTVFLDPIDTGGWLTTIENNGATKDFNYGAFLGSRYSNSPNIVWDSGNDFNDWNTNASDNNLVTQVMAGIASTDTNHIQTIEINADASYSSQDSLVVPYLNLNSAYTYYPTYDMVLQAYNSGAGIPVFMTEANYEFENDTGGLPGNAGAFVLREQEYWTLFSGGTSQLYGNRYTWTFNGPKGASNWQSFLDSPGAMQIQYFNALLQGLSWWNMVPDSTHVVVTAGYGNYDASNLNLTTNTFSPTAWVIDGSLAMTYDVTGAALTVNMAQFKSAVTARWYDPTNGTYTPITGSPFANNGTMVFTPPGRNSTGDPDWILVLQ
jgi:chitodextrinase